MANKKNVNFDLDSNMCVTHFVWFDLDRHFVCLNHFFLRLKFVCVLFFFFFSLVLTKIENIVISPINHMFSQKYQSFFFTSLIRLSPNATDKEAISRQTKRKKKQINAMRLTIWLMQFRMAHTHTHTKKESTWSWRCWFFFSFAREAKERKKQLAQINLANEIAKKKVARIPWTTTTRKKKKTGTTTTDWCYVKDMCHISRWFIEF